MNKVELVRAQVKELIKEQYPKLHTFMWEDFVVITTYDGERSFVYYRDGLRNFVNVAEKCVLKNSTRK